MKIDRLDKEYSVSLIFEAGEKCFCCSKIFVEKTQILKTFDNAGDYIEYLSQLKYFYNVDIDNQN